MTEENHAQFELKFPFLWGSKDDPDSETITTIVIPNFNAGCLRGLKFDSIGVDDVISMMSKATGKPPKFYRTMSAADAMVMVEKVTDFLGLGLEIGND